MNLTFHFCSRCGTYLYKETDNEMHKDLWLVAAGTLEGGEVTADGIAQGTEKVLNLEDLSIDEEFWVKYRPARVNAVEGAEQLQEFV
jgi:hypothetical protein